MNIDEGYFETTAKGKSKAGKLKDVCQGVYFFTDGYFDFGEKLWKSGGKVIDDSRWYKDDVRMYPVLLDRFAYVKNKLSTRWKKRENFLFFSKNSCTFYLDTYESQCPIGNFICREPDRFSFKNERLTYEEANLYCEMKNSTLSK